MKLKLIACLSFLLNTALFGTYYAISKEALGRIDPIVFTFFEMTMLVPAALCIIALSWHDFTRAVVKRGILLGSCLCLALFTIAIALKYTSATSTAFFPALNGFLAAIIAWLFLRQPISKATWFAGLLSIVGAVLLIMNSPMGGIRGSLIAFLGGLFFTCYVFLSDHEQKKETAHWPLFGVELLTMAVWANLVALLFGDWQSVHPSFPKDIWIVLYVASACTFLPTLITVLMQKYISPVTVSFIYILEPILGAVVANVYLHELLPLDGYIGGALVVTGALVQTWGSAERPSSELLIRQRLIRVGQHMDVALLGTLVFPLLILGAGGFLLYRLSGFPPPSWRELYALRSALTTSLQAWHSTSILLLVAQGLCWFIAWVSLTLAGLIAIIRALRAIRGLLLVPMETPVMNSLSTLSEEGPNTDALPPLPDIELWDEYASQQIRVESYVLSSLPTRRKEVKSLAQQRRRPRRQHLSRVELVEITE